MNMLTSKRGQASNYFAVIVFLVVFGFIVILTYVLWIELVNALTAGGFLTDPAVAATVAAWTSGFRAFDYVMVFLLVVLIIGTGLSAYLIRTDSTFFIVTLIAGIFWGFVSYFFNYIFIQLVSPSVFDTAIGFFPRTMIICTNLHWVMLVLIVVGSITLYGKKKEEPANTFLT